MSDTSIDLTDGATEIPAAARPAASEAQVADFVALLKPRVMSLVVFTGFAGLYVALDYLPPDEPNVEWWLTRPLWLAGPALATYPFLLLRRRLEQRRVGEPIEVAVAQ